MKIHKEHFEIPEILHRWKMSKGDLIYLVETDQLRISARIVNGMVRFEDRLPTDKMMSDMFKDYAKFTGLLDLWPDDACLVLLKGQNLIDSYRRPHFECSRATLGIVGDSKVTFSELLVRREERDRFEAEKGFVYEAPDERGPVIEVSRDFRYVRFEGKEERYGPKAANAIRDLKDCADKGVPWQSGKQVAERAGSTSNKLGDVFRNKKLWREFIEQRPGGEYRLQYEVRFLD